jgi:outer membrane protein OmpA-like peptidoglycan-associated protein
MARRIGKGAPLILCAGVSMFAAACATHRFVRDEVASTEARIAQQFEGQDAKLRETDERAAATRQQIDGAEQRIKGLNARVGELDTTTTEMQRRADQRNQDLNARVGELGTAATETQRQADQAAGVARDAEARLAQRIADRNKYRVLETRFIYFQSARSDISDAGVKELDEVAKALQADPNALVELQGFSDPRGSDRYNDELARERVEAVVRHLVQRHGIELRQIRSVAMGKVALAAGQAPSKELLADARRVEIRVVAPWSSWEDSQAGTGEEMRWPSASVIEREPEEPAKGLTTSPNDQNHGDDAGFTPDDATAALRVLEGHRRPRP